MSNISTESITENSSFSTTDINAALQISGMAIWEYNPITKATKLNDNWFYMLEYSKNELEEAPETFLNLLHPEDLRGMYEFISTFKKTENNTILEIQYRMKTKSNNWKWVRNRCSKIVDDEGELIWIGTIIDISRLKETEKQVTTQNIRLNAVVNSLTDIIYEIDENYIFINCWVPEDHEDSEEIKLYIGKNIQKVFTKRPAEILKNLVKDTIATGKPQRSYYYSPKNQKYFLSRTTLINDPTCPLKRVTTIVQDITEHEKTRLELVKNEANLRAMIHNTQDVFWALDTDKNMVIFNEAFKDMYHGISGKNPEIGQPLYNGMLLKSTTKRWEAIHQRSLDGFDTVFSKHIHYKDGTIRLFEFHINPLKSPQGEIIGSVVTGRDIDEIYQAKKQAEKATRLKSKFVSTISHEIRTPLNAILGTCHQLVKNNTQDNLSDDINILNLASENLLSLINDVLDFTKLESGKGELKNSTFQFNNFLEALQQLTQNLASTKNIKIDFQYSKDLPYQLTTDKTKLHQILTNLLSNAIKYTEIGTVTFKVELIKTADHHSTIGFTVADTGIGIPSTEITTIFDSFMQSSTTTQMLKGGTGLGLSITKNLVELLNGRIKVDSEHGTGSTFYVEVDFNTSEDQSANSSNENHKNDLKGIKVLVAEDNEINAKIITRLLTQWNAKFDLAINGQIAIDLASSNDYDLILMDIQMPIKNGFEASSEIREGDCSLNLFTPIVALTAQPDFSFDSSYKEGLFNGYVLKPFHPDKLKRNIIGHLAN